MFYFTCPHCTTRLECEDESAGEKSICPECQHEITMTPPPSKAEIKAMLKEEKKRKKEQEEAERKRIEWERNDQKEWNGITKQSSSSQILLGASNISIVIGILCCITIIGIPAGILFLLFGAVGTSLDKITQASCKTAYYTRKTYELLKENGSQEKR